MAENERLGASFSIDITNLKAGLSTANKLIRESESEFKAAAAGLDDWTKSSDGLNAKIKSLNQITDLQQKKVDALQSEYDNLINNGLDPASNSAVELRTKINNEKAALEKNEAELRKQKKALEEMGGETDDTSTSSEKLNKLIRESESEFKAAAAGLDDWTQSSDGLNAKIKSLNQITDLQKKKVDALQSEYDNLINNGYDPASSAAVELRTKINNEKTALAKNEAELQKQKKALEEMGGETDDTSTAAEKLRKTVEKQSSTLAELKEKLLNSNLTQGKFSKSSKELRKQIDDLSDELENNKRKLGETGDAAEKASDGFTVAKGAIAGFISNGLSALVGACKNAIGSIAGLAEETREYREDMGKLETAWQAAGKSTELATKTYKDFYSVLGEEDRSVEAVNHLAKFVDTEKDMQKWTDICTGVWGTFGDSLPIEGLTEASNETAKVGKLTGVLADALNWAGVNEDKFQASLDKCANEQERQQLITETLNGLYGEAAEKYRENNKSVIDARKATSDYTDSMAALGEKVEPITTRIREGFNKILQKVLELTEDIDFDGLGEKIDNAFDKFIDDYLPKILDGLKWLKDNSGEIAAVITGIGAAMATMFVANKIKAVVDAFKAYKLVTEGATVAQWALNVAQNANPIGLIVAAVVGLVAAFVVLWKKSEKFRNFWKGLWRGIKKVAKSVADWFVKAWGAVSEFFVDLWDSVKEKAGAALEWIKSVWGSVSEWFNTKIVEPVKNFFVNLWENIKEKASETWDGIKEKAAALWEGIKNIFSGVYDWLKEKIFDPIVNSTLFKVISELSAGCWEAIKAVWSVVSDWFNENIIEPVKNFFANLWENLKTKASETWENIKLIWSVVSDWFNEKIIEPVKKFFTNLWDNIKTKASDAWNGIKNIWGVVTGWFNSKIVEPVKNYFANMWDSLKTKASDAWEGIKSVFSPVVEWFENKFRTAWQKVKDVFSTGGKIFDGIKEGITSAFKSVVNAIIRGINKVIAIPFNAINNTLDKIRNVSIAGLKPFSGLISRFSVPEIPQLAKGGVIKRATTVVAGEDGKEAIVPLERNTEWIDKVADKVAEKQPKSVIVNQTNNYSQAHSRYELYKSKQQTAAAVRLALSGV